MAGMEKSGNEILLEQLTKRVGQLASEQKAKEALIKELNEQIKIAEREMVARVALARDEADREIATLRVEVAPLKTLLSTCERLRQEIEQLKKEKNTAVTDIKTAKSGAIQEANSILAASAAKLGKIEHAIDECKRKVAGL
jgi:uncharacterized protein YdaT